MSVARPAVRRVRRFFDVMAARPIDADANWPTRRLDVVEQRLFFSMPAADQRHCVHVCQAIVRAGHRDSLLLKAALLHDLGKAGAGITIWHRVAADLGRSFWPSAIHWLAGHVPSSLGRPLSTCLRHEEVGSEMARSAGIDQELSALIGARLSDDASPEQRARLRLLREYDSRF